jgi:DNA-binding NarL/FixJ family response regulator
MKLPRLLLADDHVLVMESLRLLLQPHFEIVGIVLDGRALLDAAQRLNPDVIVADIGMPLLNGLEAGIRLKELMPRVKLVFLTMNEDPDFAREAMRCGASGYLLKRSAASELLHAIHQALRGKSYVTPQIAREMQNRFIRNPHDRQRARSLTTRQREVVQLLAEGKTMKEAGGVLKVAPRTIAFHKYRIMDELGIRTTAELIHFAFKSGAATA